MRPHLVSYRPFLIGCWPSVRGFLAAWATCLATLAASPAHADQPAEWVDLFNGRDLAGWQIVGQPAEGWAVADGLLQIVAPGGWLATAAEYDNFELQLEYLLAPGGNSGVFLRAPLTGRSSRAGLEIQLIDDFTDVYGPLESWQLSGSLYHVAAARPGAVKPAGQWQSLRVTLDGPRLAVILNSQSVLEVQLDAYPQLEAEHPGLRRPRGHIGLQNYGGRPTSFRNIRLRPLTPTPPR